MATQTTNSPAAPTTAPPGLLRVAALLKLDQTGDVCAFIQQATAALTTDGECDDLRMLLIRRLSEQGLLARAAAVARGLSEAVRARPDYTQLMAALTVRGGGGQTCWERYTSRFQANLTAIAERYPWAEQIAAAWECEGPRLELHLTRTLGWQVFDARPGPNYGWQPCFMDHRPEKPADVLRRELINGEALSPLVLDGVEMGEHLPWLCEASRDPRTRQSTVIYQIETSWLAMAVALHLADWTALVREPRVRLCCGPDALEQFERAVAADSWNQPPREIFVTPHWGVNRSRTQDRVRQILDEYLSGQATLRNAIQERYTGRGAAWWACRYDAGLTGGGPPLRVLGITCRFTTVLKYSVRDALNAFEANGCITRCLIEPNDYSGLNRGQLLLAIREFEPDLLLMIDHTRQHVLPNIDVPFLTWIQDRLPALFSAKTGAQQGPLDFCMGFNRRQLCGEYGYPVERFLPTEMATDPGALLPPEFPADTADLATLRSNPDARYACDLAYATNTLESPDHFHARVRESARFDSGASLGPVLDALYDELRALQSRGQLEGGVWREELVRSTERNLGASLTPEGRRELEDAYVRPLADRMLRLETVEWAVRWAQSTGRRFHLYGRGWEQHPQFARYARGYVEHGPDLGAAFRSAHVNLHTGVNPSFHQRVLDTLAAGGFLLLRRHSGDRPTGHTVPPDLNISGVAGGEDGSLTAGDFWPELDRVTFGNYDELTARLERFLTDPQARWAIADAMRSRMLRIFGYRAMVASLLKWMPTALRGGVQ